MGWFDLLAIQGTLNSLLQHNSKASVLQCSSFFLVQLSHPYMTTVKIIALTIIIKDLKAFKVGFICVTMENFQMYKLGLEKAEK